MNKLGMVPFFLWLVVSTALAGPDSGVTIVEWGTLKNGESVKLITLQDGAVRAKIATYGAQLISLEVPQNVVLGHETLEDAEGGAVYGSVIGRYANRISGGGFTIDGTRYDLESVNPKTGIQIHGGKTGFQRQNWEIEPDPGKAGFPEFPVSITLKLRSPHGHEGFPGNISVWVQYRLKLTGSENSVVSSYLEIEYRAETDRATHANLTNHAYFNLGAGSVAGHQMQLHCREILEFDERKIPTGRILEVAGTPFDYRKPGPIGQDDVEFEGLDHCFVVPADGNVGTYTNPETGLSMEIATDQPGVQIYASNHFKNNPYPKFGAICFETQHYPDTPNQPDFPSTLLRPGEPLKTVTRFSFKGVSRE